MKRAILFVFAWFMLALYSCRCRCLCDKGTHCVIASAVDTASFDYKLVHQDIFCVPISNESSLMLQDSIEHFKTFYSGPVKIISVDSTDVTDRQRKVKCSQEASFTSQGYACSCRN